MVGTVMCGAGASGFPKRWLLFSGFLILCFSAGCMKGGILIIRLLNFSLLFCCLPFSLLLSSNWLRRLWTSLTIYVSCVFAVVLLTEITDHDVLFLREQGVCGGGGAIKGIVHPKIQIMSLFTHLHVVSNTYDFFIIILVTQKETIYGIASIVVGYISPGFGYLIVHSHFFYFYI